MNKKLVSVITALTMVTTLNASVLAEPLSEQIKIQQQKVQDNTKSLKDVQKKREDLEVNIEKTDSQIEGLMNNIGDTKKKISKTQDDIKLVEKDIVKAENDIKDKQDLFNKRVRAMYISGTGSYLNILLDSKGLSDLISNAEAVKKIIELDNKIIADLNDKKVAIERKKEVLNNENNKLLALKADNEKKLSEINSKKQEQDKLIAELNNQERMYASKIDESQSYINSAMSQIENARKSVPKYTPSRGSTTISSNAIVAYASNFLGTPYEWGGNGPSTFDCSGYVKYVYGHFGVNLPRVSEDQQNVGTAVSRDGLQPGDLVFFGYPAAHHVGIYVGDNCYIHAPKTGDVVKISPLNRSDFSGGRRVR
ncbi:putative endopeptidase p60 precursor [Clostridium liquoris]|uniref:Putative endopeptidase p60 n=1 Tax=Clostridium liquoris TaxID=1289519 RepID=A0A2T0BAF6_9CLOT|nr:NlpC/P60 family protein [Clostridium liquoris]PRR80822.1 putative endopeptidase p60 precursor [Clostridium liquoris]